MFYHLTGNSEVNSQVGIILPTYCEAQNIGKLITELESLPLNMSILVIDDSSPDGTAKIVYEMQRKYSNLFLFIRPQKSGLGGAITDGFKIFMSLKKTPDYIVTMDADYSHNPQELPQLVSAISECDLVIGSRYCRGGKTGEWSYPRKIISRGANILARSLLGLQSRDCTSGFRCYSTCFLKHIISYLHSHTYEIQIETINQAHKKSFKVKETPILFMARKSGKSKLTLLEIQNYISYILKSIAIG